METSEKFLLEDYGIDVVLFDQMVGTLELEDQQALDEALETVAADRRAFIAKTLQPYLNRYEAATDTEHDSLMLQHANLGANAMLHAVALTHLPYTVPLLDMSILKSEEFLERVINVVGFDQFDENSVFRLDEAFVNTVCGAGVHVLAGNFGEYPINELMAQGKAVRNAVCIENLTAV